ncbi:hypothetical protein NL676_021124 [Syzygium grande]|nr:hypothetical protein NL676_021124 [Syzygium grande]
MGLAKGAGLVIMLAVIKGVSHAIVGQMLAASTKLLNSPVAMNSRAISNLALEVAEMGLAKREELVIMLAVIKGVSYAIVGEMPAA